MDPKRVFKFKSFLNTIDSFDSVAAIAASINEHDPDFGSVETSMQISDCSRNIHLDFDVFGSYGRLNDEDDIRHAQADYDRRMENNISKAYMLKELFADFYKALTAEYKAAREAHVKYLEKAKVEALLRKASEEDNKEGDDDGKGT